MIFFTGISGVSKRLCPRQIKFGPRRELRPEVREEVKGGGQQDGVDTLADRGEVLRTVSIGGVLINQKQSYLTNRLCPTNLGFCTLLS